MRNDLLAKADRQAAIRTKLLIAVAENVSKLLRDKTDEWDNGPSKEANRIDDLIREFEKASQLFPLRKQLRVEDIP